MDFALAKSNPCGKSGALRGCPPLEGVAENAAGGWSEGETSPTFCNISFLANSQFSSSLKQYVIFKLNQSP